MANTLGQLVVKLGLDAAEFTAGLTKAEYQAQKFRQSMEANGKVIGQALGIGITAASGALLLMVRNAINAADHLNDLSRATGVSVETLGGLGFAAKQSGTDLDGVAKAFGKLRLQIAAATSGNADAVQLFDKLKISVKDLNTLSSEDVLLRMADQFATFDDHANTAALANKAFGKSYQDILPLLSQGGEELKKQIEYYAKWGGVTTETAKQADEFNDTLGKLELLAGSFGRQLASALLPSMQAVANEFVNMKEKGDGFKDGATLVADMLKTMAVGAVYTASEFQALGTVIGARAAQLAAFGRMDFKGAFFIGDELKADIDKLYAQRDRIISGINNPPAATVGGTPKSRGRAPGLPDVNAAAAEQKAALDAALREQERIIKEEEQLLQDHQRILQQYFQDNKISIEQYYRERQEAISRAASAEAQAYAREEATLRAFKPKDQAQRIQIEEQLSDVIAKRARAEYEADQRSRDNLRDRTLALREFQGIIEDIAIALKAAQGDTVGAGMLAFERQVRGQREALAREGVSQADIDSVARLTENRLKLNEATKQYGLTLDELGIAQQHVDNLLTANSVSELEALRLRTEANKELIPILREELVLIEARAQATGQREDIIRVRQLKVQLEGLEAQGDLVAKKFTDIFETSFADAISSAIDGTKSLSDAFRDMERSIVQAISRIAAQNIAQALFGGSGVASGAGSLFSSIFGGNLFGGGSTALPGGFSGTGFASGTNYAPGGWAMVGERGPEIVNLPRGAQVISNSELVSRRNARGITINVNVLPGASRATVDQAAVATAREVARATGRNG